MTNKIFTKVSIKRRDVFNKFIDAMVNAGWQIVNNNTSQKYVLYSTGNDGNKKIYLEIFPYDGSNGIGNATYDMRSPAATIYSSGLYRLGKSYNPTTDVMDYYNATYRVLPFNSSRSSITTTSGGITVFGDYDVDMYYYADKERIMVFLNHWRYTGYTNLFMMLGLPEESFLVEDYSVFPTNLFEFGNCNMANSNKAMIAEKPKNVATKSNAFYQIDVQNLVVPLSPNVDGEFVLSEFIFSLNTEGIRCRVGGVYSVLANTNRIMDGDTIVVTPEVGPVQKYRFCDVPAMVNYSAFFANPTIAIRIQ